MVRGLAPGIPRVPKAGRRDCAQVSPGRPWRDRFSPARQTKGGPCQNRPRATWRDFRQPVSGFNFLPLGMARGGGTARGPKGCSVDHGERLLRSPAVAPQWSLLPGKSNLGYFPHDPACVIHNADACFLNRPV